MKRSILKIVLLALIANTSYASNNTLYIYTNFQTSELAEESISLLQCLSGNAQIQWELVMSKSSEFLPRLELEEIDEKNVLATILTSATEIEKIKVEKNELTKNICNKILKNKKINFVNAGSEAAQDRNLSLSPSQDLQNTSFDISSDDSNHSQKSVLPWVIGGALVLLAGFLLAKKMSTSRSGGTTTISQN